jgi:DNA polymerase-4
VSTNLFSTNPFIAKMATDMQKPDGLTIIHKKDLPQKHYSLKLTDILGVGPRMEQRLWSHNIRTVEKLCSLQSQEFKKIWGGVWGERIHLLLQGIEVDLPQTKNKSMSHQHVMPPDKRNSSGALDIAKKLLIKLAVRLRRNNFYTKNLHVSIRFIDQGPDPYWERHLNFTEVRDTHTLLKYLENIWKTYPKNKKPLRISITFSDLVRQNSHQFSFFENPKK